MSQQTTIRKLAELVDKPVEKLLEQLAEAGMSFNGPDQVVTSTEKMKLLGFLRRTHGKAETPAEDVAAPKKITLNRSRKQELTVGGGKNRQTVDVVVRKKVTLVKPSEAAGDGGAPVSDERAEILRKLEESRQRNLTEQQKLAEEDKRRRELVEARNQADAAVYTAEKTLKETGGRAPANFRTELEQAVTALKEAIKGEDVARIRQASEQVEQAGTRLAQAAQQTADAPSTAPKGADGTDSGEPEIVDAEFEEVDKRDRKAS